MGARFYPVSAKKRRDYSKIRARILGVGSIASSYSPSVVWNGHEAVVKLLLIKEQVDINSPDDEG